MIQKSISSRILRFFSVFFILLGLILPSHSFARNFDDLVHEIRSLVPLYETRVIDDLNQMESNYLMKGRRIRNLADDEMI